MVQLIPIALIAFIPIGVIIFSKMSGRRAVMVTVLAGTMFLPMGAIDLPMVALTKSTSTSVAMLLGALLMAPAPLSQFRLRLVDLPMLILLFVPFASAIANGMAPYDGFAAMVGGFLGMVVPYVMGRAYLTDVYAIRDAGQAFVKAGLVYIPFCLAEMAVMPITHLIVYGVPAHPDLMQGYRLGGWRPIVFMQHGLMVGMFMCGAGLTAFWMWRAKVLKPVKGLPPWLIAIALLLIAVACKSTGAIILMLMSFAVLLLVRLTKTPIPLYVLVLVAPIYITARTVGGWEGDNAVQLANEYISKEHGGSISVRFSNENVLVAKALTKAALGWGPGPDWLVKDADGRITSIPDGLWVIQLGSMGLVGLFALFGAMLTPTIALMLRFPVKTWKHPAMVVPITLAVFMGTYVIDCLMNAMMNQVYLVLMGGLASLAVSPNPMPRATPAVTGITAGQTGPLGRRAGMAVAPAGRG